MPKYSGFLTETLINCRGIIPTLTMYVPGFHGASDSWRHPSVCCCAGISCLYSVVQMLRCVSHDPPVQMDPDMVRDDVPVPTPTILVPAPTIICSNCKCQPVASIVKCGFDDWCERCDESLFSTREYHDRCNAKRFPPPPVNPVVHNAGVCPCGFFAIRNRPLAHPGKENLPLHLLVTVPISANSHVVLCLLCESIFKRHRNALKHLRLHHQHYHQHHITE